jgi:hypothetical protein
MHLRERRQQALASRYVLERGLGHGGRATVLPDLARSLGAGRFLREIRRGDRDD